MCGNVMIQFKGDVQNQLVIEESNFWLGDEAETKIDGKQTHNQFSFILCWWTIGEMIFGWKI